MIAAALKHLKNGGAVLTYGQGAQPEDVYMNPDVYPGLFPWLYPYGYGGFGNVRMSKKLSVEKHVRALLMYHDHRFQEDRYFPFLVFNRIQIKRSTKGGYILTQSKNFANIAEKLQHVEGEALDTLIARGERDGYIKPTSSEESTCFELITYVDNVASHVPGSLTQKKFQSHEVRSMIYEFGSPAVFATFAPAGAKSPICLYLCGVPINLDEICPQLPSHMERLNMTSRNPVACSRFFHLLVKLFIRVILRADGDRVGLFGKTSAYYGTVEEQGRLALHLHMLIWIRSAYSPQEIRDRVMENAGTFCMDMIAWMESFHQGEFCTGTLAEVRQRVREKMCKPEWEPTEEDDELEQYNGDSVTQLPRPPPSTSSDAEFEAWFNQVCDVTDEIVMRCNVHDEQHRWGCKRGRRRHCKARMPRETRPCTVADLADGTLLLKKGEAWVNTFSVMMVYLLRCNTDVTFLLSGTAVRAVMAYVTDYITKTTLKTYHIFEAIRMVLSTHGHLFAESSSREEAARRLMTKIVNALTARTEIGAPLVCHLLLGFPDHYTNQRFKPFFWQSYVRFIARAWGESTEDEDEENVVMGRSGGNVVPLRKMNDYVYRPDELECMTLEDFLRSTETRPLPDVSDRVSSTRRRNNERALQKIMRFKTDHPRHHSHGIVRLDRARILVYLGGALPRKDKQREDYCRAMLTFFFHHGWRTGLELRNAGESWDMSFTRAVFSPRHGQIMKNMNVLYECLDARHDFASQRRAAERAEGLNGFFDAQELEDLDKLREERDVLEGVVDSAVLEELDAMLDRESRATVRRRLERERREGEMRMLDAEGYRKFGEPRIENTNFADTFVCTDQSSTHWKELTARARNDEIAVRMNRKENAVADAVKHSDSTLSTNAAVDEVRIRTEAELDAIDALKTGKEHTVLEPGQLMTEVVETYTLNTEQERAFRLTITHILGRNVEPLRLYLGGSGGTGKSRVFDAIKCFFDRRGESYRYLVIAPTGSAACLIGGSTYHSVLGFSKSGARPSAKALARARERLALVDILIIDEISMLSCTGLYNISERISNAFDLPTQSFAGRHVIIAGDFAQLPPPGDEHPLYSCKVGVQSSAEYCSGQKASMGRAVWHYFTSVILLRQNMRQKSAKAEDRAFGTALQNMRYGACTAEDVRLLKSRICSIAPGRPHMGDAHFRNVPIITGRNLTRDAINEVSCERFARERGLPLVTFVSRDKWGSGKLADTLKETLRTAEEVYERGRDCDRLSRIMQLKVWNLPPADTANLAGRLRLCMGMPVLLKRNVATELGATNGAEGNIVGWDDEQEPTGEHVLKTLFVRLAKPVRPFQLQGLPPNVIPVTPSDEQITCKMLNGKPLPVRRHQVEVLPAFAMTDFNSQGHTRPWNPVDLSQCYTHMSIYTALSRGTSLEGTLLLCDFDDSRIRRGMSKELRKEFWDLEILNELTRLRVEGEVPFSIVGMSRGVAIRCFQQWKGPTYVPPHVPAALNWSGCQCRGLAAVASSRRMACCSET
ncbi:hypothetical protein NM688_g4575 [Phlebia brevispora]|uniref:Uncharacterized protein n=1 Tax=Phlebia brevispora TaxID=194682 RepID=A0ACC1T2J3_9APHY|nr:hypothetical protein NM688_g4575 [Phlebia brevispora]